MGNRIHEYRGWHNAYKAFYEQVQTRKGAIREGRSLSADEDKEFLKKLLYEKSNGIASRGQSVLSMENFESFIRDKVFLESLEKLMLNPNEETYRKFGETWRNQGKSNNPVLVNRTVAACTLDVSTAADSSKFNQVFDWLVREKIINYPLDKPQDWFSKNKFLMEFIKGQFKEELESEKTDGFYLSQFVWLLYENMYNPFSLKKQIVKYGPPGTGKTYQTRQQTSLLFDIWKDEYDNNGIKYEDCFELIQFHPSFCYEDFIEGLRPVPNEGKNGSLLILQNGVFKEFCKNAGRWEIDYYNLPDNKTVPKKAWEKITIGELEERKEELKNDYWSYIFDISDKSKLVSEAVPPYFFVIDEINRAELSRVFGELMYCLEYRGVKGSVKTQYSKLNDDKTGMIKIGSGYQFFIPNNVYLIGTMNTIDRSVESFDFALRRRFRWEEVLPDMGVLKYHLFEKNKDWTSLSDNLEMLNQKIVNEPLLGSDYQIGHAYLMNLKYPNSLTLAEVRKLIWDDFVKPLLQEYLRGSGKENELISSFGKAFGL
jgi:5-methylcytosine-specific restriction protein B